jgi:hypothetical protein
LSTSAPIVAVVDLDGPRSFREILVVLSFRLGGGVSLKGQIDGVELANFTNQHYPNIHVIVTSGCAPTKRLPEGATFMPKPWIPLDLLREAERSKH